jgi:hypothetical protein
VGVKYPLSLVIQAVDKAVAPLRAMRRQILKMFQPIRVPLVRLGNRLSALAKEAGLPQLVDGFKGVGTALGNVRDKVADLGKRLLAIGAVAGAVFFGIVHGAVEAGDALGEQAQRVGLSVNAYAQLQFAAEQADVPAEQFTSSMDQLNKRLGEMRAGGGPLLQFLQKVSPALLHQVKAADTTEGAFYLLVKAFEKVRDPARRAAFAAAAFGKAGLQMGQFAGMGEEEIDSLRQRFGEIAGDPTLLAQRAGALDNAMRESRTAVLGLRNALAAELFPALTELAKAVTAVLAGNRLDLAGWARTVGESFSAWVKGGGIQRLVQGLQRMLEVGGRIFDAMGGWPTALAAVAAVMAGPLLGAVGGLISSVITLGAAIGFTPVGWILAGLAAVAGIAVLVWRNFDRIKGVVGPALGPLREKLGEVWAQLKRLWEVLGPLVMPAINALGKAVGVILVTQLQNAAQGLGLFLDLMGRWVGFLADVAAWAERAWEAVRPLLEGMEKLRPGNLAVKAVGLGAQLGGDIREWWSGGPPLGVAAALPAAAAPAAASGETRVMVDFANVPRGVRVAADPQGTAPVDLSLGYSMFTP